MRCNRRALDVIGSPIGDEIDVDADQRDDGSGHRACHRAPAPDRRHGRTRRRIGKLDDVAAAPSAATPVAAAIRARKLSGAVSRIAPPWIAPRSARSRAYSAASRGIGGDAALHVDDAGRVKLAVKQRLQHQEVIGGTDFARNHAGLPSAFISIILARASRDMTVPIGIPLASAISR